MSLRGPVPFRQRYRTSRQIFREAWHAVRSERGLWRFPILSGVLFVVLMVGIGLGVSLWMQGGGADRYGSLGMLVFLPIMMVLSIPFSFLGALLNSAYAFGLHERMDGRDVSAAAAWARARAHAGTIFRFTVVTALVSGLLALVGQLLDKLRLVPFVGAALQAVGAYAWAVAAFFVVPIIVVERERCALDALRGSVALARDTWGRSTAGMVTISLCLMVPLGALVVVAVLATTPFVTLGIMGVVPFAVGLAIFLAGMALMVLAMGVMMTLSQATTTAYQVALYRTVRTGNVPLPFTPDTLVDAWDPYRPV